MTAGHNSRGGGSERPPPLLTDSCLSRYGEQIAITRLVDTVLPVTVRVNEPVHVVGFVVGVAVRPSHETFENGPTAQPVITDPAGLVATAFWVWFAAPLLIVLVAVTTRRRTISGIPAGVRHNRATRSLKQHFQPVKEEGRDFSRPSSLCRQLPVGLADVAQAFKCRLSQSALCAAADSTSWRRRRTP